MAMPDSSTGPSLLALLLHQRESWSRGERISIEALLKRQPGLRENNDAVLDLIYNEVVLREERGEVPRLTDYLSRFPHLAEPLRLQFEVDAAITAERPTTAPLTVPIPPPPETQGSSAPASAPIPGPVLPNVPGCVLLGELGRGAMGVVYRAWQKGPNRIVALKVLSDAVPPGRVRTEAEAAARLQHANIVQVFEVKEVEGRTCLVLEYVDGGTLSGKLGGRPQPAAVAAKLVEALARAMAYAHDKGVIHRDLKPGNVLLDGPPDAPLTKSDPKISDFGLAKLLIGNAGASLTRTNDVLGTPCYMAPEQAEGKKTIGPAADVYSLGAILYELLTGRPPFLGETVLDTLAQVLTQDPVPPRQLQPGVPRDLETICLKCLHKNAARRYTSALDLAEDLRRFQAGETVRARPTAFVERAYKWARRRPAAAALLIVSLVAGSLLIYGGAHFTQEVRKQRDLARARADELDDQLKRTRRLLFTAQLLRVGAVWQTDPIQAQQMLEDESAFPPDLRDFAWGVLHTKCKRYDRALLGHDRDVQVVAFQPAPTRAEREPLLASAGRDGKVKLWDARRGKELAGQHGHTHRITGMVFSPDGNTLVTGCMAGRINFWDVPALTLRHTLEPRLGPVRGLAISPDGKTLAVNAGPDKGGSVALFDVGERRLSLTLPGRTQARCGVAFSPNGKLLACADTTHKVLLWDVQTTAPRYLRGHARPVTCVAFSPDSQTIAAGADDGWVRMWDLPAWDGPPPVSVREMVGDGAATSMAFSPDGALLAVASEGAFGGAGQALPRAVLLYDLARKDREPRDKLQGHQGGVRAVAFSPDGKMLASGGDDRAVLLWKVGGRPEVIHLAGHDGQPGTIALTPDGKVLAWARGRPTRVGQFEVIMWEAVVWDVALGQERRVLTDFNERPRSLALSPNGQVLATADRRTVREGQPENVVVKLWDANTGQLLRELGGRSERVLALAFSPDGRTLAAADWDRTVHLWDVASGTRQGALSDHGGPVTCMAFSSDGKRLAAGIDPLGGEHGQVKVWDVGTRTIVSEHDRHVGRVTCVAFAPDGATLASGGADALIRVWDVAEKQERFVLRPGGRRVTCLAYSPDGATLASGGTGAVVKLWDATMGQDRASLPVHADGACFLAFTADGRALASGDGPARPGSSGGQTLRLWYSAPAAE
jgi:WD40 repeat protein